MQGYVNSLHWSDRTGLLEWSTGVEHWSGALESNSSSFISDRPTSTVWCTDKLCIRSCVCMCVRVCVTSTASHARGQCVHSKSMVLGVVNLFTHAFPGEGVVFFMWRMPRLLSCGTDWCVPLKLNPCSSWPLGLQHTQSSLKTFLRSCLSRFWREGSIGEKLWLQ